MGSDRLERLRGAARALVVEAFESLRRKRVIPTTPPFSYIQVGRDYYGSDVAVEAAGRFERLLAEIYPERFGEQLGPHDREFPEMWSFALIEAAVARVGQADAFEDPEVEIDAAVDDLLEALGSATQTVSCCRVVSHLTTVSGGPVEVWDVEVRPEGVPRYPGDREGGHRYELLQHIKTEIPLMQTALNRVYPFVFEKPHSLLTARETVGVPSTYNGTGAPSARIDRFLLVLRLLTGATTESFYEIEGTTRTVSPRRPEIREFPKGMFGAKVRRTGRLDGSETPAFAALSAVIDAVVAAAARENMAASAVEVALGRFATSYVIENEFERIVTLATALEATLSGGTKSEPEALTYKLRARTAALLATADDPARTIFDDVSRLYTLRSAVVHGLEMTRQKLHNTVAGISTIDRKLVDARFGVAAAMAADRMREIVRRAILARLFLAEQNGDSPPLWPLVGSTPVDSILADDETRLAWRSHWRGRLEELGYGIAADRAPLPIDWLEADFGRQRPRRTDPAHPTAEEAFDPPAE